MRPDLTLAYLGLEVPDPASLTPFFADVVGLVPGEPTEDGALTWRNDDRVRRLIVRSGPANDAAFVGFETADDATFDATVTRLQAAGFEVDSASEGDAADRRVRRLARTTSGAQGQALRNPYQSGGAGDPRRNRAHDLKRIGCPAPAATPCDLPAPVLIPFVGHTDGHVLSEFHLLRALPRS